MKRLQVADRELMEIALRNEILRSEEARYDHRLHGVLLVCLYCVRQIKPRKVLVSDLQNCILGSDSISC